MLRRDFLGALLAPRVDYRDYSRILPDYLRAQARQALARRDAALAQLTSPDAIAARQRWVRDTFWRLAGGEPARTPLNLRVPGGFERAAYRVEKLLYETQPGLHVPANLYIPKSGKPPYPAVLFQLGHSTNGKAASFYQYCCQGLAQLGFLVLAFDPMGQGERTYYPKPGGVLTRLRSADDEHSVPGKQLILTGDTSTRLQTWDAVRSLDVLASHPLADPKRLASTGNSGGGTLTMMLAAVDARLACAAPACPNTENLACENFNAPGSTDDAEQNFLYSGPEGFDRWDTLYPMAPKPLLILTSARDFFGTYSPRYIENNRAEFAKLQRVYRALGRESNLAYHETPLPHGLSHDMRMEIYAWFRKHLQGIDAPLDAEPPVTAETDETLYVGTSGNAVRDFASLTPHAIAKARARNIATPAAMPDLKRLLALDELASPRLNVLGSARAPRCTVDAVEIAPVPGVFLPAWVFRPRQPAASTPLLVVEPGGRNGRWNEEGLYQELAARGRTVCSLDVRMSGDLRPEYPRHSPQHASWHQDEDSYAWSSMMLGRPLAGQRVTDILAAVHALDTGSGVALAAHGAMTVPALFAASLSPRITALHLAGGIESFRSLVDREDYNHTFANFLFDILRHTDIPQLLALLKGRKVQVHREMVWDAPTLSAL